MGHTRALFAALAWLDAFERTGGRIWCDGRMFAVTFPAEPDETLPPPDDWRAVVRAAYTRERRRYGLEEEADADAA